MNIHVPDEHEPKDATATPEKVFFNRRRWLTAAGILGGGTIGGGLLWNWWQGQDEDVIQAGRVPELERQLARYFPMRRDAEFDYGRDETLRAEAARYTNFYEFSRFKQSWRYVDKFQPHPWELRISGLCRNPLTLDIDTFHKRYAKELVERQYRHRCVERWAMAVPWSGVPLRHVLEDADPLASATHVRFISFQRPQQAPLQAIDQYPWPYTEGLRIEEARLDLVMLATGVYGQPLLKQHGAPLRLVVPWKYGYKSIKSIARIELTDTQPATFWTTLNPPAYPFESNVEPDVPRPWPQHTERMLGSNEKFPTQRYNGYEKQVAHLYA